MDLGWAAQTFAPESYMMEVELVLIDLKDISTKPETVWFTSRNLVEEEWTANASNTKDALQCVGSSGVQINSTTAVYCNSVDTSHIGRTLMHSTPNFNFDWSVDVAFADGSAEQVTCEVYLLFYPNPYFDQRY